MATLEQLQEEYKQVVLKLGNLHLQTKIEEQKLLNELATIEKQAQVFAPPASSGEKTPVAEHQPEEQDELAK